MHKSLKFHNTFSDCLLLFFKSYSALLTILVQTGVAILLRIRFTKLSIALLPHQSDQTEREGEANLVAATNSLLEKLLVLRSLMSVLSHGDLMLRCIRFPPTHVTENTDLTFKKILLAFTNFILLCHVLRNCFS